MSYFEGDSDDDKKIVGSDDDNDSSDSDSVVTESDDDQIDVDVGDENIDNDDLEEDLEDDDEDDDELEGGDPERDSDNEGEVEKQNIDTTGTGKKTKRTKKIPSKVPVKKIIDISDDEDDDDDGESYLQKFDKEINKNYLINFHPECVSHNYNEVVAMSKVVRDNDGIIIDDLHRTLPFLTKFEKSRILGQRAKQINSGATPFVKVPENVIDGYLIAELELKQKRIPFIIRRPLPNGGSEYWSIKDLEDISF